MKRGIVSLPAKLNHIPGGFSITDGGLTQLEMNFLALYWDELLVPVSFIHYITLPNEQAYMDSGFLKRPRIPLTNDDGSAANAIPMYLWAQTYFLDIKRREESDSDWRLNQIGVDSLCLGNDGIDLIKGFRVDLVNALPVPDASVSIYDILEFKLNRKSEIEAFNNYLDELYLEVANSGDFNLSRLKAFNKLKLAIEDLEKLNEEGWRSPIRFDTSAVFESNNGDIIAGISALYAIWESSQGNIATALSIGVTSALGQGFARLKPKLQSVRRKPDVNMAYLSSAHKSGIIK